MNSKFKTPHEELRDTLEEITELENDIVIVQEFVEDEENEAYIEHLCEGELNEITHFTLPNFGTQIDELEQNYDETDEYDTEAIASLENEMKFALTNYREFLDDYEDLVE